MPVHKSTGQILVIHKILDSEFSVITIDNFEHCPYLKQ